ncbi:DEAD/DEAH box helicase [Kosmotoga arenicorallina S304]|uniref:PhoH-like protein n=1 Tax=Kosmotoga arenicorallina S304 TaxID=1453497 RepID=A0A182C7U3_9BACT|nr:PhoH family protein [Kosmotoga arenicorallina]OAA31784.1 DEAD/DEAH box helicase [Kosmotoga arenicorallina S304]
MPVRKIHIPKEVEMSELFGEYDRKARFLQKRFDVKLSIIGNEVWIKGEDSNVIEIVKDIVDELIEMNTDGHLVDWREFEYLVEQHEIMQKEETQFGGYYKEIKGTSVLTNKIKPKTVGQKRYIEIMRKNDIVFSIGPAGTGKTYLAVAMAVDFLKSGKVQRIILTRPAVEAGEKLGFLPGTLSEKVDPYLRPLYDALMDMLPMDRLNYYKDNGIVEVVPLAYMRGRTLNNSFIILDEAQNSTYQQMKMFLTRIGFNSRAVITGDITQIDLERNQDSGLVLVQRVLKNIDGISFVYLTDQDVVRNPLVKEIIKAYDLYEREERTDEKGD